jgi:steroid delta-isomerase-like uncharacterized protein
MHRFLLFVVLLVASVAAPAANLLAQEASPAAGDPETLGRRYVEDLLNRADVATVDELLTADFVLHLNSADIPGPGGFKGFLAGLHEGFPDVHYEITQIAVDGDQAIVRWTVSGTHLGVFNGIPATGKPIVNVPGISWLRIEGGQIAEAWVVVDTLTLLVQIGVIPGPEAAATPAATPAA